MDFADQFVNKGVMEHKQDKDALGIAVEPAVFFLITRPFLLGADTAKGFEQVTWLLSEKTLDVAWTRLVWLERLMGAQQVAHVFLEILGYLLEVMVFLPAELVVVQECFKERLVELAVLTLTVMV